MLCGSVRETIPKQGAYFISQLSFVTSHRYSAVHVDVRQGGPHDYDK